MRVKKPVQLPVCWPSGLEHQMGVKTHHNLAGNSLLQTTNNAKATPRFLDAVRMRTWKIIKMSKIDYYIIYIFWSSDRDACKEIYVFFHPESNAATRESLRVTVVEISPLPESDRVQTSVCQAIRRLAASISTFAVPVESMVSSLSCRIIKVPLLAPCLWWMSSQVICLDSLYILYF